MLYYIKLYLSNACVLIECMKSCELVSEAFEIYYVIPCN